MSANESQAIWASASPPAPRPARRLGIDPDELAKQEQNLVAAMKAVEGELDDDQHGKVTRLLAELTAYNVMNVLHGMAVERVRSAFQA